MRNFLSLIFISSVLGFVLVGCAKTVTELGGDFYLKRQDSLIPHGGATMGIFRRQGDRDVQLWPWILSVGEIVVRDHLVIFPGGRAHRGDPKELNGVFICEGKGPLVELTEVVLKAAPAEVRWRFAFYKVSESGVDFTFLDPRSRSWTSRYAWAQLSDFYHQVAIDPSVDRDHFEGFEYLAPASLRSLKPEKSVIDPN